MDKTVFKQKCWVVVPVSSFSTIDKICPLATAATGDPTSAEIAMAGLVL